MLLVSVKRLQHDANGGFAYDRAHAFYRTPFEVTQLAKAFTRGVEGLLLFEHVHVKWGGRGRWTDYKVLPSVTGHTLTR